MDFIPILGLLFLVVVVMFGVSRSAPVRRRFRSRNWYDDDVDQPILSIFPPRDTPQIFPATDTTNYFDNPVGGDPNNNVDSLVGGGKFDYGSRSADFSGGDSSGGESSGGLGSFSADSVGDGDSSGGLGSAIADAVDWGGSSSGFDSGSDFESGSDYGDSSDFGSSDSSDWSSSND